MDRTISLDPRYNNIAQTYVHELLHLMNPSKSETWVRLETRRTWKNMTWQERARLYQALGKAKIGEAED